MKPLLAILNPRRIHECLDSYELLTTPRAYLTGYTEHEIQTTAWPQLITGARERGHTHMLIVSDDTVVTQRAVDHVLALLDDGHPAATGYCNLDAIDSRVNLALEPIADKPATDAFEMPRLAAVLAGPDTFQTYFAGLALTGMSLDMWDRYPFQVWGRPPGCCSDFMLCHRLQNDGVPITAHREAFIYHLKERWNYLDVETRKRLLIGEVEPAVTFTEALVPA